MCQRPKHPSSYPQQGKGNSTEMVPATSVVLYLLFQIWKISILDLPRSNDTKCLDHCSMFWILRREIVQDQASPYSFSSTWPHQLWFANLLSFTQGQVHYFSHAWDLLSHTGQSHSPLKISPISTLQNIRSDPTLGSSRTCLMSQNHPCVDSMPLNGQSSHIFHSYPAYVQTFWTNGHLWPQTPVTEGSIPYGCPLSTWSLVLLVQRQVST